MTTKAAQENQTTTEKTNNLSAGIAKLAVTKEALTNTSKDKATAETQIDTCALCQKKWKRRLNVCARCKAVGYCDATCQKTHWKQHKQTCAGSSAKKLVSTPTKKTAVVGSSLPPAPTAPYAEAYFTDQHQVQGEEIAQCMRMLQRAAPEVLKVVKAYPHFVSEKWSEVYKKGYMKFAKTKKGIAKRFKTAWMLIELVRESGIEQTATMMGMLSEENMKNFQQGSR